MYILLLTIYDSGDLSAIIAIATALVPTIVDAACQQLLNATCDDIRSAAQKLLSLNPHAKPALDGISK